MTPTEQTLARLLFASARRLYRTTLLGVPCKAFEDTKAEVLFPRPGDWVLDVSSFPGAGPSSIRSSGPPSFRGVGPTSVRSTGPLSSRISGPPSARGVAEPAGAAGPSSSATAGPSSVAAAGPSSVAAAGPSSVAASGPSSVAGPGSTMASVPAPSSVAAAGLNAVPAANQQRAADVDLDLLGRLIQIANEEGERVWYVEGVDGTLHRRPGADFIRVFEHPLAATTDEERLAWVAQAMRRHGIAKQESIRPTW